MSALRRRIGWALLAALLIAPGAALAQSTTVTITATSNNGDRDPALPGLQVDEGDTVTVVWTSTETLWHQPDFGGTANLAINTDTTNALNSLRISCFPITDPPDPIYNETFTIRDDTDAEGDETIIPGIHILYDNAASDCGGNAITNATINTTVITIRANDGASQAAIGGADAAAYEGARLQVPIIFTGPFRTAASTVSFEVTGTATGDGDGADYTLDASSSAITFDATTGAGSIEIPHTASSGSIPIAVALDSSADDGETIIVTLTGHTGGGSAVTAFFSATPRTYTTATTTIFTITGPASVTETDSDATANYLINAAGDSVASSTTVTWTVNHAATSDADFAATTGTVTFEPGDAVHGFQLTIIGDNLVEDHEFFTLSVGLESDDFAAGDDYLASIRDDDTQFVVTGPASINETDADAATSNFTIVAAGEPLAAASSVTWTIVHAATGGTSDADFAATTGTVNFAAAESAHTFTLTITGDNAMEGIESFSVQVSSADHAGSSFDSQIVDDDTATTFAITGGPASILETDADDAATYTITRNGPELTAAATVTWTVAHAATDGTDDADFSAVTGTVSFAAGDDSQTFDLTIVGDNLAETEEHFTLGVSSPGHAAGDDYAVAIRNDDTQFSVTGPDTINETDANTEAVFTVFAAGVPLTVPTLVTWTLSHATTAGTADADFSAVTGTLNFAPFEIVKIFTITVVGDNTDENVENFTLSASSSEHSAANSHAVAINDDDGAAHTFTLRSYQPTMGAVAPVTEIAEGGMATYLVRRTGPNIPSGSSIVLNWTYSAGETSPTPDDFQGGNAPAGGMLTFTSSTMASFPFIISIADDTESEPDETFTLGLTAAPEVIEAHGGIALPANISVTIGESDRPVTLAITAPADDLTEGTAAEFAVGFAEDVTTTEAVTATWTISFPAMSTATAADFSTLSGTATIAAGASSTNIEITPTDDSLNEGAEAFTITLSNPAGGGSIAAPVLHATDAAASASIAASNAITAGIAAPSPATATNAGQVTFTVTLSGVSQADVTVAYTISGTTDTPTDANGGSLTISAGQTSGSIVLGIPFNQMLVSGADDETLTVSLDSVTAATGGGEVAVAASPDGSAAVTVSYTDGAQTLAFSSPALTIVEGETATYTVVRTGPDIAGGDIVVSWSYSADGSGATSNADFSTALGGMLTFTATESSKSFTLATVQDTLRERDETFTLGLTATPAVRFSNGGVVLPGDISVTIPSNDQPVTLAVAAPASSLTEGTAADFLVSFGESVTTTEAVTADWEISFPGMGAASAADFAALSGTLTIPAGASSVNVPITAIADNLNEALETFSVALSNPAGGGDGVAVPALSAYASTSAGIAASDDISVSIAADAATVNEGGDAEFTVTLGGATAGSAADISVSYTLSSISVTPTDANSGSITIPAGEPTGAIVLGIPFSTTLGDSTPDDTLTVTLDTITVGDGGGTVAAHSTDNSAMTTVNYVDAAHTLAFSSPALALVEGESATYTVSRRGPAIAVGNSIAVNWTYTAGTAAAADFAGSAAPAGGVLTFTGSVMSQTFSIATREDTDSEDGETFTLGLTASATVLASNDGVVLPGAISVTIGESDRPVTLSVTAPANLTEGTAADFAVGFAESVTTTADVTAAWTLSFPGTGPAASADFAAQSGSVTIPAGQSSVDVSITATADNLNEAAESFTFTLSAPAGGGAIAAPGLHTTNSAHSASIAASDPISVSIAADVAVVNEGGSAAFTVTLSGASAGSAADISVGYSASGSTDTPTDANGGSITIIAGATSGAIALGIPFSQALGSSTPDDTLTVELGTISAATGGGTVAAAASPGNSAAVTINYIDAAHTLAFSSPALALVEGGSATYTVNRSGPAIADGNSIVVSWTYSAGTAAAADFAGGAAPAGGVLTFTGSVASQTFSIATAQDADSEPGETFTLGLTASATVLAANGGVALPGAISVTIGESDRPLTISIAAPATAASEGGAAQFTVSFAETVTTSEDLIVSYTNLVSEGMGTARNEDFAAAGLLGEVTIAAGQRMVAVEIPILADNRNEGSETFTIRLGSVRGGGEIAAPVLADSPMATATIAASDPITARIARAAAQTSPVTEGSDALFTVSLVLDSDGTTAATSADSICVTFTTAVAQSTTLDADSSPNTAQNPDIAVNDCSGAAVTSVSALGVATGGVTIPMGQSSATLAITARFDNEDEGSDNETLSVTLSTATHTSLTGAAAVTPDTTAATAEIANSNALRTLAVSPPATAVDEDSVTADGQTALATFTITLSGSVAPETDMVVPWSLTSPENGGINLPGASGLGRSFHTTDLAPGQAQSGTVTFPAGSSVNPPTEMMVMVQIAQDALNEGAEQLQLQIGMVDPGAGCASASAVLCTMVADRTAQATVAASDDITIFLAPAGDQGTLLAGDSARYVMSFGATTVNGQVVPIVPSAPLTVQVMVDVGGRTSMIPVTVQANEPTAEVTVPAATINPPGQTGTPTLTVSIGTLTGAPSGATVRAGTQADVDALPANAPNRPAAPAPAPRQTAGWDLAVTQPSGAEAPEGAAYQVVFTLDGAADELSANGLTIPWSIAPRTATGGRMAEAADFAPSTSTPPAYTCGAVNGVCATFPSGGPVTFTTGESSQTLEIRIRDDGDNENMMPDGFTLTLGPLGGADASRTVATGSLSSTGSLPLEVTIPALRADLSVANATAAEGANAVFTLTLANFTGGAATTQPVAVTYTLGGAGDTATPGADYTGGAATATAEILAGAASAVIAIPLVQDGVLEPRETFTLTITGATGGGGSIRLVNAEGAEQAQITATGTITDDADQSARRQQRVGALVTVLDRQTAIMATDAITARLNRNRAAADSAQLSIANRNLLGSGGGGSQSAADDSSLGLALYGAAGLGGATAGLPGSGGAAGASTGGGNYTGGAGGGGAFAGLGAGLAGGANMGSQTALPSLAELVNGSSFSFQAAFSNLVEGVQVWGSGGLANLDGNPQGGGATLDYDGDNLAFFLGADSQVLENMLAGFALGWASGDLDFTDRAGMGEGAFSMSGKLSNDMLSLHPYLGWQISPNVNAWLVLGFGFGSVDISENEGSGTGRISRTLDGGDSNMLMVSAGIAGRRQFGNATDLKLRFEITRVSSEVDAARFDDGALLPGAKGRSGRIGGELELGHRFSFGGVALRPFATLGLRLDNNDSVSASTDHGIDEAFDAGGGVTADWPTLGLDGRAEFSLQLNDTGHEEQRFSLDLNFDPGADSQGITLAVQTALSEQRSGLLNAASGRSGLASPLAGAGGAAGGGAAGANRMARSISGELGYGVALRQFGRAALLTPYGRFNLGSTDQRWAAGLRLAQPGSGGLQLGIEAGLDLESARANAAATTPARSYDLLLTGRLRF